MATDMDKTAVEKTCPACGGELEPHSSYKDSLQCGCGWLLVVPGGYQVPGNLRLTRCPDNHVGAWTFKRLSRRLSWRCSFVLDGHRCQRVEYEATPQGFLAGQTNPAFSTRDAVIAALYTIGAGGGFVEDMIPLLPHLKPSQVYSCLYRLVRYRRPYVLKSRLTEPRIRTYAHRYILSPEGVAFCYLMWPALVDGDDSWKRLAVT